MNNLWDWSMKKFPFLALVLTTSLTYASDVSLGDVSARLDSIEKRLNGQDPSGEELATKAEVDSLRNDVKYLIGRVEMLEHKLSHVPGERLGGGGISSMSRYSSPASDVSMSSGNDSLEGDVNQEEDVADLLKALEGSAPNKPSAKEVSRQKATEDAEKNAPTPTLPKNSVAADYDQAQEAYKNRNYENAQAMFTAFARAHPKDGKAKDAQFWAMESRLRQAEQDKSKDMAKKSAKEFAEYIRANKDSHKLPLAVYGLGRALDVQGDTKNACTAWKKAKELTKKTKIDSEVEKSLEASLKKCNKK
jgi:tetratricopeptide (TPR) repeat protein